MGRFAFLARSPDSVYLDAGWREFIEEDWKHQVWIPARTELSDWEKIVINRIEEIRKGKIEFIFENKEKSEIMAI